MTSSSGGNTSAAAVLVIVAFAALLYSVNAYFRRDRHRSDTDTDVGPRQSGFDVEPRRRPPAGRSAAWWVGVVLAIVLVAVALALRH